MIDALVLCGHHVCVPLREASEISKLAILLLKASAVVCWNRTLLVPANLDDITAATLANPGMSCWAALMERAHFQPGETVLIYGATGSSGTVAVQFARHLSAKKIIVTGRNAEELEALRYLGADVVIAFDLRPENTEGVREVEEALRDELPRGLDVVVDYLWGTSARTIIVAIAKAVEDAHPVRFVQAGEASREPMELPAAALRSSAIQIMGSGLKSVPFRKSSMPSAKSLTLPHKANSSWPPKSFLFTR